MALTESGTTFVLRVVYEIRKIHYSCMYSKCTCIQAITYIILTIWYVVRFVKEPKQLRLLLSNLYLIVELELLSSLQRSKKQITL